MRMTSKPDMVHFSCSYCDTEWDANSKCYRMEECTVGAKMKPWYIFHSICPKCKRETTVYVPKGSISII